MTLVIIEQRPSPPLTNLVGFAHTNFISLQWKTTEPLDLLETVIYRALRNNINTAVEVGRILKSTQYLDFNVIEDRTYFYWIRGVNNDSQESGDFEPVVDGLSVTLPATGWLINSTDSNDYFLEDRGEWVKMDGLQIIVEKDVGLTTILNLLANINILNITDEDGFLEISYGINGIKPQQKGIKNQIEEETDNLISVNISTVIHKSLVVGDVLNVWIRITEDSDKDFDITLNGSTLTPHEFIVGVVA